MKKIIFVLIALCFVTSLALAQDATQPTASTTATTTTVATSVADAMMLKGDIIDNLSAATNKDTLADFVKTNTKELSLKPEGVSSGYSIFANGMLYKFDQDSSVKVGEFLKNADSKLQVSVTAKQVGDELSLVSIENQK